MKNILTLALIALGLPLYASAHETHVYEINGKEYELVIGSLNEPIVVDDKTGVELRVAAVDPAEPADAGHSHDEGSPVAGLETALKVELIAGESKKTLELSPMYGTPGAYKAPYIVTVPTTLTYRIFGEIDGTAVDLPFTCSQRGHTAAEEVVEHKEISPGVIRHSKTGSFGCPTPKADMGFPEKSQDAITLEALAQKGIDNAMVSYVALALALSALFLSWRRR